MVQKLIALKMLEYKKFQVLMKIEPYIILKLFLNFSDSEPKCSYNLYSYKTECITKC